MRYFKSRLEEARRSAEHTQARIKASVVMDVITGGGSMLSSLDAQGRQGAANAREQQRHYRGQSFISIRPIAQKIAMQPIRLAKLNRAKGKSQRSIEVRQCELPKCVEQWSSKGFGGSEPGTLEIVDQHPILDAIHKPEAVIPDWTIWHLKYCTIAAIELTGGAYWWMPIVKGKRQVWYLPSSWVRPVSTDKQLFVGYEIQPDHAAEPAFVPVDEISRFFYPDPSHPFGELGPFQACAKEIMVDEFVVDAQKRTFQQGPHPSCIVRIAKGQTKDGRTIRGKLREHQREDIRQALNRTYRGMLHYGEPMILDGRVESIDPYGNEPKNMDFGTNADSARSRVEQAFGTNAYITGASGIGNRAESAGAGEHFCDYTINPKIELLSLVLNMSVLPRFDTSGQYMLFIEPARAHDAEMEEKEWEDANKWCRFTINEDRAIRFRAPPVPWGDAVVVPNGYSIVPVDQLKDGYTVSRDTGPEKADVDENADNPNANDNAKPPAKKPPKDEPVEGEDDEGDSGKQRLLTHQKVYDETFLDKYVETWLKVHESHELNIAPAVETFLKEQGESVAQKLEDNYGALSGSDVQTKVTATVAAENVFNPHDWVDRLKDAVRPAFTYAVAAGATHELASFGDSKKLPAPDDAPAALNSSKEASIDINFEFGVDLPADMLRAINAAVDTALAKDYWADIQATTRDSLTEALQAGIEAGEDMPTIVKRVKNDVFNGDVSKVRAKNIARTECTHAMNAGQDAARQELASEGVISGKEWFATYDGKTRPAHFTANGQVKGVNELFDVGGYSAKYPGDPDLPASQRCACRCVASSVTVFTKHTRLPLVKIKGILARGCEIHG